MCFTLAPNGARLVVLGAPLHTVVPGCYWSTLPGFGNFCVRGSALCLCSWFIYGVRIGPDWTRLGYGHQACDSSVKRRALIKTLLSLTGLFSLVYR